METKIEKNDKFPNGLNSWLETHYQIVEYMGYNQSRYVDFKKVYEGSKVIEELDGQAGKQEFAEELTTKFESMFKGKDWVSSEKTFYDELDEFLKETFYPKKEETKNSLKEYKREFLQIAIEDYGMVSNDFTEEEIEQGYNDNDTPQELMDYLARKYDLIKSKERGNNGIV